MLTASQLRVATGCTAARADEWLPHIIKSCETFAINTPVRLACYLPQIGHESGRLVYVREIWGPTPAQQRYEGRADLGNTQPGDGKRYMGRGLIQTTGRANYRATRDGLAAYVPNVPDLEAMPALLERPDLAAMSAAWFWHSKELNTFADLGDFIRITKRINGGTNGLADRLALYEAAKAVLL